MSLSRVAILGGTFDPVHCGHLRSAVELRELLGLDQLRLIPAHRPPHRAQPIASATQRLQMLKLALADEPGLIADACELERSGPSYTFDTLTALRETLGANTALSLVVGTDAFAELHTWHRWRELLDVAHIVVVARPGAALPMSGEVAELLQRHRVEAVALRTSDCGAIAVVELTPLPISATAIRTLIRNGKSPRYLLPDSVWQFIREHDLYRVSL
jgi:nicotinate-nucleotide adenylyltransferase